MWPSPGRRRGTAKVFQWQLRFVTKKRGVALDFEYAKRCIVYIARGGRAGARGKPGIAEAEYDIHRQTHARGGGGHGLARGVLHADMCGAAGAFELCGIMYHSDKGRASVADRGVPLVSTLDELAALKPDYMVLSLKGVAMFDAMRFCAQRGIPALCETFGARTVDELNDMYALLKGARIQFAEQYQFQPLNAARLALARSGALGQVYHVRMSIPTRYHPVSLMRLALGAGQRLPVITARAYSHAVLKGPGRAGDPVGESEFAARQEVVTLDYGDVQAVNDFEDMQHCSFMRSNYFLIRGGRGEIVNEQATWT